MSYERFSCRTLFDITQTDVVGRYRPENGDFTDASGTLINSQDSWTRSRNQQRNFETVIQTLSLRAQITDVTTPQHESGWWTFHFTLETPNAYGEDLCLLMTDMQGVPMIAQDPTQPAEMIVSGVHMNIQVEKNP